MTILIPTFGGKQRQQATERQREVNFMNERYLSFISVFLPPPHLSAIITGMAPVLEPQLKMLFK
jgi:hypothetical protein